VAKEMIRKMLFEFSGFMLAGTGAALLWANIYPHSYEEFYHATHFLVNDVAMALFFALAAKEVWEALLPGGKLSTWGKASMPVVATIGGMAGPALVYAGGCYCFSQMDILRGTAIPCATDIAFSFLAARIVFGATHPAIPFLLMLAIVDDAGCLVVLAMCYPSPEMNLIAFFVLVPIAIIVGLMMRKKKVQSFWLYLLIPGSISWLGFHLGGIHSALALVPVIPLMPHAAGADIGPFVNEEKKRRDTLSRFEAWWEHPVQVILGFFGLVNAGVVFSSFGPATFLVLAGLLVGKPVGITLFALIGKRFGLELPDGMNKKDLIVVGIAAGIGFTVALFVSSVAFTKGSAALDAAKMGALLSFFAFVLTWAVAKILRIKKAT